MWLHEVLIGGKAKVNTVEYEGSSEEEQACVNLITCMSKIEYDGWRMPETSWLGMPLQ